MTSIMQFRMDSRDKEALEKTLKAMGLDCATAFRMFAMQVIKKQAIPFKVKAPEQSKVGCAKLEKKANKKAKKEPQKE